MTIYVTQEDIDRGCRSDAIGCPIARAVYRATGKQYNIGYDICAASGRIWYLPEAARAFIQNYDLPRYAIQRSKPEPFSFELNLPEPKAKIELPAPSTRGRRRISMRIEVTQDDINKGKRSRNRECPIALAIQRCIGKDYSVGSNFICTAANNPNADCDPTNHYALPLAARRFIHDFDSIIHGLPDNPIIKPFTFNIDLPGDPEPLPIPIEEPELACV